MQLAERRELMFAIVANLEKAHAAWSEDTELTVLSEDLWNLLDEACEVFGDGDIPSDCRKLSAAVDALAQEWEAFKLEVEMNPEAPPPHSLWHRLEKTFASVRAVRSPPKRTIEPIKELLEQKVSHPQICNIYGWMEIGPDGRQAPQLWKLREEIESPGKHTGAGFVPPVEQRRLESEARQAARLKELTAKREEKVRSQGTVGKETLKDLVDQGLYLKQMATIKKTTPENIARQLTELGLPVPELRPPNIHSQRSTKEPEIKPEAARAMDVPRSGRKAAAKDEPAPGKGKATSGKKSPGRPANLTPEIEAEIMAYSQQGFSTTEIRDTLDDKVSARQIEAVVNRYADQEAAAAE